jgi:hypothetical protein
MRGRWLLLSLVILFSPLVAHAQEGASISGVVRDAQGSVIPGVTVEAASPVLIEKVRTSLTDGTGRYVIPNLRPGTYTITFTLTGFTTVKREGIQLTGTGVTTVDADMRVGSVTETITVSGETPIVDVQTVRRQTVLDQEVVTAIPTSRNSFSVSVLIPGVSLAFSGTLGSPNNAQDVGGSLGPSTESLSAHGSRLQDQRQAVNGVALSTMIGGGWGGGAVPNATGTAEFAIDTAAVDAALATGGPRVNFIPKDGGNRLSATIYGSYATESFQSEKLVTKENFPAIRANTIDKNGDFNPGFGGPIVRDKVWFYLSGRYQVADNFVPGMFYNLNANKPDPVTHIVSYNPDPNNPAKSPRDFFVYMGRMTWQANPKNKFGLTYDYEGNCFCPNNVSATRTPEAATDRRFPLQRFVQVDWNSPVSSKLLLEASAIHRVERWGDMNLQTGTAGNITALDPTVIGIADVGLAPNPGFNYGAAAQGLAPGSPAYNNSWNDNWHYRAAISYITGSHQIKVGFNNASGHFENLNYDVNPIYYTFTSGVPTSITIKDSPYTVQVDVDRDLGFFAQDRWTLQRWSLYGGIRYDSFKNSFPAQDLLPSKYVPNRPVTHFAEQDNISWNDITPKLGASYDVFGTGKTALKVSLNKYLLGYGTAGFFENGLSSNPHPINTLTTNTSIGWNDANHDLVPQCNLLNPAANGECTGWANPGFGSLVPTTTYDPNLLTGWGKRNYNWEFSAGVQHELLPRVSLDVSYFRRIFGNFQMTDNRALSTADFDTFTFVVPTDSRLPNSGKTLTAVDARFPKALAQDYFVTLADDQGVKITDHWDGVDFTVNARPKNGLTLGGGVSVGREAVDECDLMTKFPENTLRFLPGPSGGDHVGAAPSFLPFFAATPLDYCNRDEGFQTQVKLLGAYTFPKIDVQIAGTYQSIPGGLEEAQYLEFSTGTLGRPYGTSVVAPFRIFQIVEPGTLRLDRINQFDLRVSKIFRIGITRTNVNFDLYNVFNSTAVTQENLTYTPPFIPNSWRQPQYVVPSRFFKISAQFDF